MATDGRGGSWSTYEAPRLVGGLRLDTFTGNAVLLSGGMSKALPKVVTATRRPAGWDVTVLQKDRRSKPKVIGTFESVEDTASEMLEQALPSKNE